MDFTDLDLHILIREDGPITWAQIMHLESGITVEGIDISKVRLRERLLGRLRNALRILS